MLLSWLLKFVSPWMHIDEIILDGKSDFMTGIQIAQMALKHRSNKSQRQRIVVFVASPIE